jgi:type IV pilus assembly protein PilE
LDFARHKIHAMRDIRPSLAARRSGSRGFTLVELAIVVVVVAILGAVAYPLFIDSIRKGRRSEAMSALAALQQAQERWRSSNPAYTATLSSLNVPGTTSPGGYYTLSVSGHTDVGYTAVAVAVSSKSQAHDGTCAVLGVRVLRGNISYGSCSGCSAPSSYAASDACWKR